MESQEITETPRRSATSTATEVFPTPVGPKMAITLPASTMNTPPQARRGGPDDINVYQLTGGEVPGEVDDLEAPGPAHALRRIVAAGAGHHDLQHLAHQFFIPQSRLSLHGGDQSLHPPPCCQAVHFTRKGGRPRTRTRRVDEGECGVETTLRHQGQCLLELRLSLTREAYDDVCRQCKARRRRPQIADKTQVVSPTISATHVCQNSVAARLYGKVQVPADFWDFDQGLDQLR